MLHKLCRRSAGFTLIELTVAMAVIALAIASIVHYQRRATDDETAIEVGKAAAATAVNLQQTYRNAPTYGGPALGLFGMGLIPPPLTLDVGAQLILDPWGNDFAVVPDASVKRFQLVVGGRSRFRQQYSADACATIATILAQSADSVYVGNNAITIYPGYYQPTLAGLAYKAPDGTLSPTNLASACSGVRPLIAALYR